MQSCATQEQLRSFTIEAMATSRVGTSEKSKLKVLQAANFAGLSWLRHGFSTRKGGVSKCYGGGALNLGLTEEDRREAVEKNRELFFTAIGAAEAGTRHKAQGGRKSKSSDRRDVGATVWPSVAMKQIHSSIIHHFTDWPQTKQPLAGDGLITNVPGVVLTVRTADCIPVLIVDPVERAVGAFHAGWRGTLARIVEKGVGEMRKTFGSDPANLKAAIGPGIHACCYEVSEDLKEKFAAQFAYTDELFEEVFSSDPVREKYPLLFMTARAPGHGDPHCTLHLNLIEANRRQLLDSRVPAENIWTSDLCTSCRTDLLFSHRKEHGKTGRMVAAIAIAK